MSNAIYSSASSLPPLRARRDTLETKLSQAIASGGTRSALRETVEQLIDHLRVQGIPASRGHAMVMEVASRALGAARGISDDATITALDWMSLISAWASARYSRAD